MSLSPDVAAAATTPAPRPRRRLVSLAVTAAVLLGGGWLVARQGDDLTTAVTALSPTRVVAAGALAVIGTVLIEQVWWSLLRGLGAQVPAGAAAGMFFVTQLGKYLPGSVWPTLGQMAFGARWGVPRRVMLAAGLLLIAAVTATGAAVGGLLLPWSSPAGLARYWWLLLLLVPLAVVLHPKALPWLLDRALARAGREPTMARLSRRGLAHALGWCLATWVVLGAHVGVLLAAYDAPGPAGVAAAIGGIGLAWAAGIAFVPAPAGAGVRDAVLVLTLLPFVDSAAALTIALTSRVLLLLADVGLAGVAALARVSPARPGGR